MKGIGGRERKREKEKEKLTRLVLVMW